MTLREFLESHKIRYTPWAKANDIPASCVHRHLEGGGFFKPATAKKIHTLTDGKVDLISLCPDLVGLIPGNGNP